MSHLSLQLQPLKDRGKRRVGRKVRGRLRTLNFEPSSGHLQHLLGSPEAGHLLGTSVGMWFGGLVGWSVWRWLMSRIKLCREGQEVWTNEPEPEF